jgi:hypothetical protein
VASSTAAVEAARMQASGAEALAREATAPQPSLAERADQEARPVSLAPMVELLIDVVRTAVWPRLL